MPRFYTPALGLDTTDCTGVNTGSLQTKGGAYVTKQLQVSGVATVLNATSSTSTTTGSLVNYGGLGNAGDLFNGGQIASAGKALVGSTNPGSNHLAAWGTTVGYGNAGSSLLCWAGSGEANVGAFVQDGTNNYRLKLFVDNTAGVCGLVSAGASAAAPLVLVVGNVETLRSTNALITSNVNLRVVGNIVSAAASGSNSFVQANAATGYYASFQWINNAILRNSMLLDTTGANWQLNSYNTSGTLIDSPIAFQNVAGTWMQLNRPTNINDTSGSAFAVSATGNSASMSMYSQTGYYSRLRFYNNTFLRTGLWTDTAGDNFVIGSFNAAGGTIDSPVTIPNVAGGTIALARLTSAKGMNVTDGAANMVEKVLSSTFANGVANQKMDILLGNLAFYGTIEVTIASSYGSQVAAGRVTKVFSEAYAVGGTINENSSRYSEALGQTPVNFAIGDLEWDAALTAYKIPIAHQVTTGNGIFVSIRAVVGSANSAAVINGATLSAVYTTDPTVFPTPSVAFTGSVTATQFNGSGAGITALTLPVGSINATGTPSSTTYLRGDGTWATISGGGSVTNVSTAVASNGVTATWANPTSTPALTIGLGNITPTSVATSGVISTTNATAGSSGAGALAVTGGAWVGGLLYVGGNITAYKATAMSVVNVGADSGQYAMFQLSTGGFVRGAWMNDTTGANTQLGSYDATGTNIDYPIIVPNVASGVIKFNRPMQAASFALTDTNTFAVEKELSVSFPNTIANQKVDLILGNIGYAGFLEVTVTSGYGNQVAGGCVAKRYSLNYNPNNTVYENTSRFSEAMGQTPANFTIGDLVWDAGLTAYKIQIIHRVSTGNVAYISVRGLCGIAAVAAVVGATVGAVYTTDTTVWPAATVAFNSALTATQFNGSGAGLTSATVPVASINASGTPNSTTYLRGDGTWAVPATGLTNPMSALGDLIFGGAAGAPTRLAGNISATTQVLTQTGNGSVSAAPVWVAATVSVGSTAIPIGSGVTTIVGLTSITSTNITGTLQTAAQPNITSVGTLTGLLSTGDIQVNASATQWAASSVLTGHRILIAGAAGMTKLYNVTSYANTGAQTGTIKITLPVSWTNTMLTLKIGGWDYTNTTGAWRLILGGYTYSAGPGWVYSTANLTGNAPFTSVRLGHDGTNCCILIGVTTTTWNYPKIEVGEVVLTQGGISAAWTTGWTTTLITSETGITVTGTPSIGSLTVGGAGIANLYLKAQGSNSANVQYWNNGYVRTAAFLTTDGGNYTINTYTATGTLVDAALTIPNTAGGLVACTRPFQATELITSGSGTFVIDTALSITFGTGIANQKADIILGNLPFAGTIEVTVTSTNWYQQAAGCVTKRYSLEYDPNNVIRENSSRYTEALGQTPTTLPFQAWSGTQRSPPTKFK